MSVRNENMQYKNEKIVTLDLNTQEKILFLRDEPHDYM